MSTLVVSTFHLLTASVVSFTSGIEELCSKRDELNRQIQQEEKEKGRLQHDIRVLTEKLSRVNESLARRLSVRADFDHTIGETEGAFMKVRTSQGLGFLFFMRKKSMFFSVILVSQNHESILCELYSTYQFDCKRTCKCTG